jgi:hypothetical protein
VLGVSTPDQIAVAQLWGHAERCAAERIPVDEAVAGLRAISERPDLLAQAAGTMAGSAEPHLASRKGRIDAARLLVQAGADREQLARWIAQGRQNAARGSGWTSGVAWPDDLDQVLADVLDGVE